MSATTNSGSYRPLLRPMDLGEVLDHSFKLYRHAWKPLLTIGLVSAIPTILLQGVFRSLTAMDFNNPTSGWFAQAAMKADRGDFGDMALLIVLMSGAGFLFMLLYPLVQGAFLAVCSSTYMSQPITAADAFRTAGRRYLPLLGTAFIVGLMVFVSIPLAVIAGLVIFSPFTIIAAIAALSAYTAFTRHAILLEGAGGGIGAIKRSFKLVSGRFWPLLGMGIIFAMLVGFTGGLVNMLVAMPVTVLSIVSGPNAALNWLVAVVTGLSTAVTAPFMMAGLTLAYYDTRIRKEGYDLELMAQSQMTPPSQPL